MRHTLEYLRPNASTLTPRCAANNMTLMMTPFPNAARSDGADHKTARCSKAPHLIDSALDEALHARLRLRRDQRPHVCALLVARIDLPHTSGSGTLACAQPCNAGVITARGLVLAINKLLFPPRTCHEEGHCVTAGSCCQKKRSAESNEDRRHCQPTDTQCGELGSWSFDRKMVPQLVALAAKGASPCAARQQRRTFRLLALATSASFQGPMPPTNTAALMAMHRWPAAPNAAPASALTVASRLASGMMTA